MTSGKMSRAECGRLGAQKTNAKMVGIIANRRVEYDKVSARCLECSSPLSYEHRRDKFCSQSCSAIWNNKKREKKKRFCSFCGNQTDNPKYCSNKCQKEDEYRSCVKKWLDGEDNGVRGNGLQTASFIKRWVSERNKGECSICKGSQWQGKPMPLVLDHVDGNGQDNKPENLRVVCGNCNMLLPTFAGRNRGSGRLARKKWDKKNYAMP